MSKRGVKKTLKKSKKGEKRSKKLALRRKAIKSRKNRKNRMSFKKMPKRKLKRTLKKAKKKIQQQLKHIGMKGGSKDGKAVGEGKNVKMHKEVPQDPNQSEDSVESTKAAAEVSNQANVFNELEPNVIESFSGISSGSQSIFSSQPSLLGGAKMPKPIKQLRKTMKKRLKLMKKHSK